MPTGNEIAEATIGYPLLLDRVNRLEKLVAELEEENKVMARILDAMTEEVVEEPVEEKQQKPTLDSLVKAKPSAPKK